MSVFVHVSVSVSTRVRLCMHCATFWSSVPRNLWRVMIAMQWLQAKRLEMIRGDHAKNATVLDHVERAMTPQQPRSTRPPYSPPFSLNGSTQPSRNEPAASSPAPGRGLWSPNPPRAMMDRASSSSPAPDLSSYTVPTPVRQILRHGGGGGRGHVHAYSATASRGSPLNFSGSLRSSAAASGSVEDSKPASGVVTRRVASPSDPPEGEGRSGGGGLRDAGVVARFLEEVRPLLSRLGPPFSCAFPDRHEHGSRWCSQSLTEDSCPRAKPSTLNPQSSSLNPQTSALNPQSSIFISQASALDPKP